MNQVRRLRTALSLVSPTLLVACALPAIITPAENGAERQPTSDTAIVYAEHNTSENGRIFIDRIDGKAMCAWTPCTPIFRIAPGPHTMEVQYIVAGKFGSTTVSLVDAKPRHVYQVRARSFSSDRFSADIVDLGDGIKEVDTKDPRVGTPSIVKIVF